MKPKSILVWCVITVRTAIGQDSLLTAREAVDIALQNNLRIQIARNDQDIARINNNWGNAGKWPTVTAGIGNTEALTNLNQQLSNGSEIKRNGVTNNILSANLSANWRIYNGMRVRATKERFGELEKMSEIQLKQEITRLTYDVLIAYYNIVRLDLQVRATSAIIDLSREREKIAETRFNVGSAAKTDLLQASIDLNSQKVNLENIRQQIRVGKSILNNLLRRDPDAALAGSFGDALIKLGGTLQDDARLKHQINRFARRAIVGTTENYGDNIVALVSDTIKSWDASTITDRVENAVGSDLQFIRINGTLVGGMAGIVIHAVGLLI